MKAILEVHDLAVRRGSKKVLEIDHLEINTGETLVLIGPNGAGKTTLIMALSQIIKPEQGSFLFHDQPVRSGNQLDYRRRISLVMQDPLLVSGSVFDNVATGLRFRGQAEKSIRVKVDEWLERLGIQGLKNRRAQSLSGGEAQRVSLARAFVLDPEILFLDEPFSALDTPTRQRMLEDFQSILAMTSTTAVMVTHDMDEALLLGDRVAVMLAGKVRQIDAPEAIFNSPGDSEVAAFVGVETIVPGQVHEVQDDLLMVEAFGFHFEAVGQAKDGRGVLLCLRPEDITLWPENGWAPSSARNRLEGKIERIIPAGPLERVVVDCGFPLVALVTRTSAREMALEEGKKVIATFKASAIHVILR